MTAQTLFPRLLQNVGGETLAEVVLDQTLAQKLALKGLIVSDDQVEAERQYLLSQLSADPNEAVRLLQELRQQRGLTQGRFRQTLWRNAAMRQLTKDDAPIEERDLRVAFDLQYGELYELRIITTPTLKAIEQTLAQVKAGKPFNELAMQVSTDPSRSQGGLLAPMSPADASYPAAIRTAVPTLKAGEVSNPIAIENGYAILKLERKIDGENVKFDDVKDSLSLSVQRQQQETRMRTLARSILAQADVVILDPTLKESWERQTQPLRQTP